MEAWPHAKYAGRVFASKVFIEKCRWWENMLVGVTEEGRGGAAGKDRIKNEVLK